MLYARIVLAKTNYSLMPNSNENGYIVNHSPNISNLNRIYAEYCSYKKFKSVMPIFDSEYTDSKNDILSYYQNNRQIAFSLLRRYDNDNVEAIQFAWDYKNPGLNLGIETLKHECAFYKAAGFKYLYLGGADEYKKQIDGFEIL